MLDPFGLKKFSEVENQANNLQRYLMSPEER